MEQTLHKNRSLLAAFTAAILLHGLLLTIPAARRAVIEAVTSPTVKVRLMRPAPVLVPKRSANELMAEERVTETPPPPAQTRPAVQPPLETQPSVQAEPERKPVERISAARILLDIEKRREDEPPWFAPEPDAPLPVYQTRPRDSLDDVLNEPVLHLPFEDTRIYLVDSYDDGFLGDMERFFDTVTVPFGYTTKNNTRIQCAWVLVLAGCAWGDAGYFYSKQEARKRKRP